MSGDNDKTESSDHQKAHRESAQKDEETIEMEEGVFCPEWARINEAIDGHVAGSNPNERGVSNEARKAAYGSSAGRHAVSSSRCPGPGPDASPGAEAVDSRAHPPNNAQRRTCTLPPTRPGAFREGGPDNGGAEEDGLTVTEGNEEHVTVTTREESTIHIVAETVDMVAEYRKNHELNRLRQMVENAVVASVIATDGDLPVRNDTTSKCGTGGRRRWFAIGGILLILVVAVAVALAMVFSSEPSPPEPTDPPEPTNPPQDSLSELLSSISSDGGEALSNSSTPQYEALEWLKDDPNLPTFSNERIIQRYALATMYYSTNGGSWLNHSGWLESDECEGWYGLTCTTTDKVSEIYIWENDLSGPIPPEIGLLTRLDDLLAKLNNLWGPIPTEIGLLTRLENLYLAFNGLTGSIPTEIGLLTTLDILELQDNQLEGTIPTEINSLGGLSMLYLAENLFTGNYTCPDYINMCAISCYDGIEACRSL